MTLDLIGNDEVRLLTRIAQAVERLGPQPEPKIDIKNADAYVWDAKARFLEPIAETQHMDLSLLLGIDDLRDILLANTMQFAKGFSANNALLWGARGMGKSSLVKAIHASINRQMPHSLVLVEIHRDDIETLPMLVHMLRGWVIRRFILFCDDLSFEREDTSYKSLKTALEGGIEGRPDHILFYATSNRRNLMPREMVANESATAIHPGEAAEEKISLSDRFGLWLGFHHCSQDTYLEMVESYSKHFRLGMNDKELKKQAMEWANTRGNHSGRVAWQFIQDLAGRLGKRIV